MVPPSVLSAAVTATRYHAPRVISPSGELSPLSLPDLYDAASPTVTNPDTSAAVNVVADLVPPVVRSFGCVAVIVNVKTIV